MSRVDDALKRAEHDAAERPRPLVIDRPVAAVADLDRYAPEHRTARAPDSDRRPAPALTPMPVRAAAIGRFAPGKSVIAPDIDPIALEHYRRLAAILEEAQGARGFRSLIVSSAVPREGKTLTATNLALTLSESYRRRVLLIDADFRRPGIHEQFGMSNDGGLAALLRTSDASWSPVEFSPTLSVLPAGRLESSPTAALSSERMQTLIADAVSHFDWVLLDTPPVGLLTDAQLVARIADGVLLVIAAGTTPYDLVQRTIAELGAERIVGTVLNRVPPEALAGRGYYGRYYTKA